MISKFSLLNSQTLYAEKGLPFGIVVFARLLYFRVF